MLAPASRFSKIAETGMRVFFKTHARYKPGFLFGMAALVYGFSRFTIEFVREPDAHLVYVVEQTGLSMGQWLTVPMIIIGF